MIWNKKKMLTWNSESILPTGLFFLVFTSVFFYFFLDILVTWPAMHIDGDGEEISSSSKPVHSVFLLCCGPWWVDFSPTYMYMSLEECLSQQCAWSTCAFSVQSLQRFLWGFVVLCLKLKLSAMMLSVDGCLPPPSLTLTLISIRLERVREGERRPPCISLVAVVRASLVYICLMLLVFPCSLVKIIYLYLSVFILMFVCLFT